MPEYFIIANSFAAPICSDTSDKFVVADTPRAALEKFAAGYSHPAGLYSAACYADANAERKGAKPLAKWMCNHEIKLQELTKDKGAFSYLGSGPGKFEIDRIKYTVKNPRGGRVI